MDRPLKNQSNLIKSALLPLLLAMLPADQAQTNPEQASTVADCAASLRPYRATYDVYRNEKLAGLATIKLNHEPDGQWLYQVATEATKGMGSILGGQIDESSRFVLTDDGLRTVHYELLQKVALSKTRRQADFDWQQMQAQGKNKKKRWQLALQGDEIDRLGAEILIRLQLAAGQQEFSFNTIEKGDLRERTFRASEAETLTTVLGEMTTIPVHRIHSNPKRSTTIWHAPELGYIPVKVEHAKVGDDNGELIIKTFEQEPCDQ